MSLRSKLMAAQLPLVLGLVLIAIISSLTVSSLRVQSSAILKDNFRSVLAVERMKDALGEIEVAEAEIVSGRHAQGADHINTSIRIIDNELAAQEQNVTEPGEGDATAALRASWTRARPLIESLPRLGSAQTLAVWFGQLVPAIAHLTTSANRVMEINQDAIVAKSERAEASATEFRRRLMLASLAALLLATAASAWITSRVIRPIAGLGQAVNRLGSGDLSARVGVRGGDEIAQLARDFNLMAERLEQYRQSSLGELLEAQNAAQAAIDSLPDPVVILGVGQEVINVNREAERSLKVMLDGRKDPLDGVDAELRAVVDRLRLHVLAGKGGWNPKGFEEAIRVRCDGAERSFLPRASPVYSMEGTVVGATIVLQDVTRLLRFDELRSNLVVTVAHDFQAPLQSVRMAIHLCADESVGPLNDRQADLLSAAQSDAEKLQSVVDELLNMSRVAPGNAVED
jgi:two-component system, NtrC family, sensor histidine kinase KinB